MDRRVGRSDTRLVALEAMIHWHNILDRNRSRKVFTRADYKESDLIQYSLDHLDAAEKLYELSGRWTWQYLHSAAFLSHLGIELLLKACLLHLEGEFPAEHDLARLYRRLRKKGIKLPEQSKKWLTYLNRCIELRYPDSKTGLEVDVNHWEQTKTLFEKIRARVPVEIQKQIVLHERYPSNVKSGKPIWPQT